MSVLLRIDSVALWFFRILGIAGRQTNTVSKDNNKKQGLRSKILEEREEEKKQGEAVALKGP